MHELSIIYNIIEIAEEHLKKSGASAISGIELEIGNLAGVEWQALDFAWDVGVQQSVLENAERQIKKVKGKARCLECETVFEVQNLFDSCPNCHSFFNEILQGKELNVRALTLV
jgi:hydrogenase nickel incorporation protein HypA/HybF